MILVAARNPGITALVTWSAISSVERWSAEAKAAWRSRGFLNIQNSRTGQVMPLSTDVLEDIDRNAISLDIAAAAERITAPWLIIHGGEDETVDKSDAESLSRLMKNGRMLILPGAGHTFGASHPLKEIPPALDQAIGESVGWFSKYLR